MLPSIKVLDRTTQDGTMCGQILADLGADVVQIEPPGGEISRQVSDSYFASLNRNKRSICLDLTSDEGRARLGELVASSHALLVNMKPSVIRKLGLTYESLSRFNPKIVCVALTGYGLDGGDDPAFDYVIQAATGVAAMTGDPQGPPTLPGYSSVQSRLIREVPTRSLPLPIPTSIPGIPQR